MLEVKDYSSRRGVVVTLLPQIHALLTENAQKDILAGWSPPENIILWKQTMRRALLDIHKRWLFVLDGETVAGFMFYHFGDAPDIVLLDEMQVKWAYRHNAPLLSMLTDKFLFDRQIKACKEVLVSDRIKNEAAKEILASVGFKDEHPGGYYSLGKPEEAVATLRLRYKG